MKMVVRANSRYMVPIALFWILGVLLGTSVPDGTPISSRDQGYGTKSVLVYRQVTVFGKRDHTPVEVTLI